MWTQILPTAAEARQHISQEGNYRKARTILNSITHKIQSACETNQSKYVYFFDEDDITTVKQKVVETLIEKGYYVKYNSWFNTITIKW